MDHQFEGGDPKFRGKLNEMVVHDQGMAKIRGDEVFISVKTSAVGGGVTVSLNMDQVLARIPKRPAGFIWARITGATVISGRTNQWVYTWVEVQYLRQGTWQDVPGGLSSASSGLAYNSVEANNSASGVQGNSVNISSLPSGFNISPVSGNPVVKLEAQFTCDVPPAPEWVFQYENAVQGSCE